MSVSDATTNIPQNQITERFRDPTALPSLLGPKPSAEQLTQIYDAYHKVEEMGPIGYRLGNAIRYSMRAFYDADLADNDYVLQGIFKEGRVDVKCRVTWDQEQSLLVLAFKGLTFEWEEIQESIACVRPSWVDRSMAEGACIHYYFSNTFNSLIKPKDPEQPGLLDAINEIIGEERPLRVLCCGYGLGGALATLGAVWMSLQMPMADVRCITLQAPRVGNSAFLKLFRWLVAANYRIVHSTGGLFTATGQPYDAETTPEATVPVETAQSTGRGKAAKRRVYSVINEAAGMVSDLPYYAQLLLNMLDPEVKHFPETGPSSTPPVPSTSQGPEGGTSSASSEHFDATLHNFSAAAAEANRQPPPAAGAAEEATVPAAAAVAVSFSTPGSAGSILHNGNGTEENGTGTRGGPVAKLAEVPAAAGQDPEAAKGQQAGMDKQQVSPFQSQGVLEADDRVEHSGDVDSQPSRTSLVGAAAQKYAHMAGQAAEHVQATASHVKGTAAQVAGHAAGHVQDRAAHVAEKATHAAGHVASGVEAAGHQVKSSVKHAVGKALGAGDSENQVQPRQYAPKSDALETTGLWGEHKQIYHHQRREDALPEESWAQTYTVTKVKVTKTASTATSEASVTERLVSFLKAPLSFGSGKHASEGERPSKSGKTGGAGQVSSPKAYPEAPNVEDGGMAACQLDTPDAAANGSAVPKWRDVQTDGQENGQCASGMCVDDAALTTKTMEGANAVHNLHCKKGKYLQCKRAANPDHSLAHDICSAIDEAMHLPVALEGQENSVSRSRSSPRNRLSRWAGKVSSRKGSRIDEKTSSKDTGAVPDSSPGSQTKKSCTTTQKVVGAFSQFIPGLPHPCCPQEAKVHAACAAALDPPVPPQLSTLSPSTSDVSSSDLPNSPSSGALAELTNSSYWPPNAFRRTPSEISSAPDDVADSRDVDDSDELALSKTSSPGSRSFEHISSFGSSSSGSESAGRYKTLIELESAGGLSQADKLSELLMVSKVRQGLLASRAAYHGEELFKERTGISKCRLVSEEKVDTQVYVGWLDNGTAVFAFRGTANAKDARQDLKALRGQLDFLPGKFSGSRVHVGFMQQLNAVISETNDACNIAKVLDELSGGRQPLRVLCTGHSLGGALATLGSVWAGLRYARADIRCITFGSPRVGNRKFRAAYHALVGTSIRIVNGADPIPDLPPPWRFTHVHNALHFTSGEITFNNRQTALPQLALGDHYLYAYAKVLYSIVPPSMVTEQELQEFGNVIRAIHNVETDEQLDELTDAASSSAQQKSVAVARTMGSWLPNPFSRSRSQAARA